MEKFFGEYKLEKSHNYEEILEEMGLNYAARKIAILLKPTVIISQDEDGRYRIKTINKYRTNDIVFELSKEFDESRYDGKIMKSIISLKDDKLIHVMNDGGKIIENIREVTDEGIKSVTTCNNIISTRIYTRTK